MFLVSALAMYTRQIPAENTAMLMPLLISKDAYDWLEQS